VAGDGSHIPYPIVRQALNSGNLAFIRDHSREIKLSLRDAITVC
jgi:hypothetical protein